MTKNELQQALKQAGVPFKSKTPKAELEKLLAEHQQPDARTVEQPDAHADPAEVVEIKKAKTPAKKKTKKKAQPKGTQTILREYFEDAGFVQPEDIEKIAKQRGVAKSTVTTALADLKNAKYAGKQGPLNIEKGEDGVYRLVK